ncbi:MAG: ORF6N domain-containing protein [Pseudomonadota bacterium]|jgi:hypothetical protein
MADETPPLPMNAPSIVEIRRELVVLDFDVAVLFGVPTRRLTEQIRRNLDRFGDDFAFHLTFAEWTGLMSHFATSNLRGGRRKPPWALTEHGVVMAATVLKSPEAAAASRTIVRAFVALRRARLPSSTGCNVQITLESVIAPAWGGDARLGLMAKLNEALGRALDAIADPRANTTVRDELHAIAADGLNAIKAHLQKAGVQNERTLAEVRKLLAEADALEAETLGRHTENQHRQLALTAKQLRIALELQRSLEGGGVDNLLATLKEMQA